MTPLSFFPVFARRTVRTGAVVASIAAAAAITAACHFGCYDPDPDCHGDYDPDTCDCPWKFTSNFPTYTPPPNECWHDEDCDGRARCRSGRCEPAVGACIADDECPYGARCESRACVCNSDVACGPGLTCHYGQCDACLATDAGADPVCRALTCDTQGECPVPLTCDRTTLECRLVDRLPCADGGACPALMACIDGTCARQVPADDAGAPVDATASDGAR